MTILQRPHIGFELCPLEITKPSSYQRVKTIWTTRIMNKAERRGTVVNFAYAIVLTACSVFQD